jgi:dynein regulatory complex protein 1
VLYGKYAGTELKYKDEEYVQSLKKQASDTETLITKMRRQFRDMRAEYASELNEIEDSFNAERAYILKKNQEEIEALFNKHQDMEYK